jgi:hypothetical protein
MGLALLQVGTNAKEQRYQNQSGSLADLACALYYNEKSSNILTRIHVLAKTK